jgi:hypothetical protein
VNNYYIRISKTQGDIIGVGVSGSGHTLGENISGPTQAQLPTTISYQYDESLKALSNSINRKLKDKQIPDEGFYLNQG